MKKRGEIRHKEKCELESNPESHLLWMAVSWEYSAPILVIYQQQAIGESRAFQSTGRKAAEAGKDDPTGEDRGGCSHLSQTFSWTANPQIMILRLLINFESLDFSFGLSQLALMT